MSLINEIRRIRKTMGLNESEMPNFMKSTELFSEAPQPQTAPETSPEIETDTPTRERPGTPERKNPFKPEPGKKVKPKAEFVAEDTDVDTYFDSFTDASNKAMDKAKEAGYEVNMNDWDREVTYGGASGRGRPDVGETKRFTIGLTKDGQLQHKALQFQVYGMESGKFELNVYIN